VGILSLLLRGAGIKDILRLSLQGCRQSLHPRHHKAVYTCMCLRRNSLQPTGHSRVYLLSACFKITLTVRMKLLQPPFPLFAVFSVGLHQSVTEDSTGRLLCK